MQTGLLPPHIVQILDNGQDVIIIELVKQLQTQLLQSAWGRTVLATNHSWTSMYL